MTNHNATVEITMLRDGKIQPATVQDFANLLSKVHLIGETDLLTTIRSDGGMELGTVYKNTDGNAVAWFKIKII